MTTWQLLRKNPELFPRYFVKEYLIKACRKFFEERNYHELESPIITGALPQERYLDVLEVKMETRRRGPGTTPSDKVSELTAYITPTTETFNKKILAAGLGEHFVITKVCRGLEEIGPNHSPEFTMLEWYHLNATYHDLMDDTEKLLQYSKLFMDEQFEKRNKLFTGFSKDPVELGFPSPTWQKGLQITYQGQKINFESRWDRVSVPDALKKFANINLEDIQTQEQIYKIALEKGYKVTESDDWQVIFELIFEREVESNFAKDKPTFVYNYPRQLCPLVKIHEANPLVCEKVELYIAGKEVANGYTELIDWKEQEKRFLEEQQARKDLGMKPIKMDTDMVEAIKSGLPDVAGIGMGLDRVVMIFADAKNIADINFFPAVESF